MTIRYDAQADAAYVRFSSASIARTEEESDVCVLDLDGSGNLVAIELLSVFGYAGSSLNAAVTRGLLSRDDAAAISGRVTIGVSGGLSAATMRETSPKLARMDGGFTNW